MLFTEHRAATEHCVHSCSSNTRMHTLYIASHKQIYIFIVINFTHFLAGGECEDPL